MVMLHLFMRTGLSFSVAHCNFQLRGQESEGDQQFVEDFCDRHNLKLHSTRFETPELARDQGISIEMAARQLRYNWFSQLCEQYGYHRIATAHHQDDVAETFFINLARGTGVRGLSGIKPQSGNLIRPMLFTNRPGMEQYAARFQLSYREDSSNADTAIRRNFIRHRLLPMLDEFSPAFRKNLLKTVAHLRETEFILEEKVNLVRAAVHTSKSGYDELDIEQLRQFEPLGTLLFELLRPYNFQPEVAEEIAAALDAESGKQFYSPTHRLTKDRATLILEHLTPQDQSVYYIEHDCSELTLPLAMRFEQLKRGGDFRFSTRANVADLDYDKLIFPLVLRRWKEGEYFQPLGMSGFKKLSDFFVDEKYSIPDKDNTWILGSGEKVVWIVGKRIDDRFKITPETQHVMRISLDL